MSRLKLYQKTLADIRARTSIGVRVDAEGATQLATMLNHHPLVSELVGCGIDYFFFKRVQGQRYPVLYAMRTDGTDVTFSYKTCAGRRPRTATELVLEAMRTAIVDQISDFRRVESAKFEPGVLLEVDHVIPFKQLADEWLEPHGGPSEAMLAPKDHSIPSAVLCDPYLTEWKEFHLTCAKLQLLTKHDHYKKTHKKDGDIT